MNKVSYTSQEFKDVCQPVVDFLNKYGCPHTTVIITQTSAELLEGECAAPFEPLD